jgi:L-rhamnose isomerase
MTTQLEQAWELAKQRFAAVGIDVEEALRQLDRLPVSMHCWQGDDVAGFENPEGALTGGIQATGNYPGKARNPQELRADLEQALSLIPGPKRLNLHAMYHEAGPSVSRDAIKPEHFKNWVEWAKANKLGLDFNPSCFSHPMSADGFTLSHANDEIRQFWIDHVKASRRISAYFGEQLGTPSVMNIWVPDGMKDVTVDRLAPRKRLMDALDEALSESSTWRITSTPLKASCSASALKATPSAQTSSIWVTPPAARPLCVWMRVTSTRPKSFPTRSPPPCCMCRACCCTSAARCAGTATTWCCWMMKRRPSPARLFATTCLTACTSAWISSTPLSTVSPRGLSAPAT